MGSWGLGGKGASSPGCRHFLRPRLPAGETFFPYYVGRAIDGIIIQKSMERFTSAVILTCLLALGR